MTHIPLPIPATLATFAATTALANIDVPIAYLELQVERPPVLTNLDPIPEDLGRMGAHLGLADNITTGGFMGHNYSVSDVLVPMGDDWLEAGRSVLGDYRILVVNAPADALLALADLPEAEGALIFNASAEVEALREGDCRANVLHTMPSYAMRADALMQFLVTKRWSDLVMITGQREGDMAFAEALRNSATKFGARILAEKEWDMSSDMRRNIGQEFPVFTQDFPNHHVMLVADEAGDFGPFLEFNAWEPRPVAGSAGARPDAWSDRVEAYGAAQLQLRFKRLADRPMGAVDYAAWAAVRSVGEAVTRTGSNDANELRDYILSDAFELAAFKGAAITYRDWNGQMRQPMPVATKTALVAMTPMPGFLHEVSTLDTLGRDRPETACKAFD
ncbi:MAG: ABC transporter, substrate binding protein, PQQ-dependent alcohol dehydrogenase system [Roseibaca calidilacus]|uniref:ABC transporter, substrate binding protein, PQQ-dependent alcohol dehydrogenase system n=1 Tax=Roseibaca calidilacus TaxID=1666912 RepID=A0A0P7WS38_9RHOB|nr:ABC transporter substrate-binding protein [Roseibaca calidilacus]KPP93509.1 MAG: ABC transporter, substrate binding protein, PQQ-dependent alcohol dehydrogenase system [Roseibaca calidilacus]CUX80540.1 amino acid/amide ABC transporter substrate-binding protein, HAAT family (TC 3.A.1.4.-) [Roseibaca calidilacus]